MNDLDIQMERSEISDSNTTVSSLHLLFTICTDITVHYGIWQTDGWVLTLHDPTDCMERFWL